MILVVTLHCSSVVCDHRERWGKATKDLYKEFIFLKDTRLKIKQCDLEYYLQIE